MRVDSVTANFGVAILVRPDNTATHIRATRLFYRFTSFCRSKKSGAEVRLFYRFTSAVV